MSNQPVASETLVAQGAAFQSILFGPGTNPPIRHEAPDFFHDLNLDQIVATATSGREEYDLQPFFYTPLPHPRDVNYRYEVLQDLQDPLLVDCVRTFARGMRAVRDFLAESEKHSHKRQKQSAFLEAVDCYCGTVLRFAEDLAAAKPASIGLGAFRDFLAIYVSSNRFVSMVAETPTVKSQLAGIRYRLNIQGNRITVDKCEDEPDYQAEVLATFEKFKEGAGKEFRFESRFSPDMNHVEAAILDLVAQLFPEVFKSHDEYIARRARFIDETISTFDREVQFYMAAIDLTEPLKQAGLRFCFPVVSDQSKELFATETFDMALAARLVRTKAPIVTNDFFLKGQERIFVVTGPNQGGKTTFARTFGQVHYLANIGFPIPGRDARLFFFDQLFTHFEREEDLRNLTGKLEDELLRIRGILEKATRNSILVMNESFLSTTLSDALFLSKEVMRRVVELDMLCVSVTFLDELTSFSNSTVSFVSSVNPSDFSQRTFKLVRRPADGLAYAAALADKYRLTYESVRSRIAMKSSKRVAQ